MGYGYPGFRDYTLGGNFSIDGDTYTFGSDFHYRQDQWSYNEDGQIVTRILVMIDGTLSVPGVDGSVVIETPDDVIDPVGSKTITRNLDGIWTSGEMTITSENSVVVEFNEDGSASFDNGWDPVPDWQDELDPIGD